MLNDYFEEGSTDYGTWKVDGAKIYIHIHHITTSRGVKGTEIKDGSLNRTDYNEYKKESKDVDIDKVITFGSLLNGRPPLTGVSDCPTYKK